jgi:hypothetical protein
MSFRHGDRSTRDDQIGENQAADAEGWVDRHGGYLYRYALLRLRSQTERQTLSRKRSWQP